MSRLDTFEREIEALVNRLNLDTDAQTPDFILAVYLRECLEAFMCAAIRRDEHRGWTERMVKQL